MNIYKVNILDKNKNIIDYEWFDGYNNKSLGKDCKDEEAYNLLKIVENSVTKESLVQVLKGIIIRDITQRAISDSIVFIEKLIEELEK